MLDEVYIQWLQDMGPLGNFIKSRLFDTLGEIYYLNKTVLSCKETINKTKKRPGYH